MAANRSSADSGFAGEIDTVGAVGGAFSTVIAPATRAVPSSKVSLGMQVTPTTSSRVVLAAG